MIRAEVAAYRCRFSHLAKRHKLDWLKSEHMRGDRWAKQARMRLSPPTTRKAATMQAHEFSTPRVREVADPTHGNQTVIATITSTKPSQRGVMLASILAVPDGTSHKPVLEYYSA